MLKKQMIDKSVVHIQKKGMFWEYLWEIYNNNI